MRDTWRLWDAPMGRGAAILAGLAIAAFSCSLLVEQRSVQCDKDGDCASFPNAACDAAKHVCVDKEVLGCEGQKDCVCKPATPTDILNACPRGDCDAFDNGRVTKLVDGGLPDLPTGDAGVGGAPTGCASGGGGAAAGTGGADGGPPPVQACELLPNPLYIIGPGSVKPLLGWVAELAEYKDNTIIYQDDSSCVGVAKQYDTGFMENDMGNEGWTTYFDATGKETPCKFVAGDVRPHIGLSDVFPQTCGYDLNGNDPNVTDTPGPVQAMGFIVPNGSKQISISAEAAYMVYGFGDGSGVSPWTDQKHIFQRSDSSGTQNMIAKTLGLDAKNFFATLTISSDSEAALVGCSDAPEKTIGILAVDLVDSKRFPIKLLSYQHFGQQCGYLPDSAPGTNDKRNVREGHYFIWGPIHMLTRKDNADPQATKLINYVSGISPPPADETVDIFKVWADAHLVPQCAMRVTRKSDGGPLSAYKPQASCYCKYDEVTDGKSDCTKCQTSSTCPAERPACSPYGFCEAQ